MDRASKDKEKAILAAIAVSMLLAGIAIGFIVSPRTVPETVTVYSIATITSVTEVPLRNMPVPYSASAQLVCIYVAGGPPNATGRLPQDCPEPNIKAVAVTIMLTELGVENSYIPVTGLTAMSPGLARNATLEGAPLDASGRIVVRPGRFDTFVKAVIPVEDPESFMNWMRDIGKIAVAIQTVDGEGRPLRTVVVEDIVVHPGSWSIG